ncbi:recombinase family protein, partial [[Pasteurella] aerogenes]
VKNAEVRIMMISEGRKFGYARVSTSQQSLELQKKELLNSGVREDRFFSDIVSGSQFDRDGLNLLLLKVEKGDEVIVTRLDRLGRNTLEMIQLIKEFEELGVYVTFLKEGLTTKSKMANLLITILSAIAEQEKERILERTREGRLAAKEKGIVFGRKKKEMPSADEINAFLAMGNSKTKAQKHFKISKMSIYRILNNLR